MKYLFIVALLVLLLLLVYSRVHPYLKVIKKVLGTVRSVTSAQPGTTGSSAQRVTAESKLVRCVGCGTWVPADRAIGSRGSATYCSRDCLEKPAEKKESKLAG